MRNSILGAVVYLTAANALIIGVSAACAGGVIKYSLTKYLT